MNAQAWAKIGAAVAVATSLLLVAAGDRTLDDKIEAAKPELDELLVGRSHHIDPWELYGAIHNNQMRLILIDVRDDADFNLFHLRHVRHIRPDEVTASYPLKTTAVVLMSNDEAGAEEAFRRMWVLGQKNTYILEGGINLWLDIFAAEHWDLHAERKLDGDDTLRHSFPDARGAEYSYAWPAEQVHPFKHEAAHHAHATREFTKKIKLLGAKKKKTGGCG